MSRNRARALVTGSAIRSVLVGSALWTLAVWATRVRLLEPDDGVFSRSRLYVSIAFGVILLVSSRRPAHRASLVAMLAYSIWMVVVWIPSLIRVLGPGETIGFQVVHTVLALVSLTTGALVAAVARRVISYTPTTTSIHTAAKSAAR